ncbi:nucleotidyltransferase family protein [Rhizosaccharibacter radicis]|uniref:Nucleotidyltransferase family protein n=1 Tax=Rhizosaccharibacter radicis TaxID=2782605 RepID=A0ABT1W0N3_9PROT|nr:nucleotidyltransferase family protein [Acetobacteraceae bacterium KSS12]
MVLAAGLGTRMRPLTGDTPKPLLRLAGRTLLDHALDRLGAAGVERVVVNAHWHGDQIRDRLRARTARGPHRPDTVLQPEPELLETGGAVLRALADGLLPADEPFFVVNGDSFWLDGPVPALARLAAAFDPAATDVLLLLSRTSAAVGEVRGDFSLDPEGRLRRHGENEIVPYSYAGLQIVSPRLFDGIGGGGFGMNLLWDEALRADRMRGIVHDGGWFHLSRPADVADAERVLRDPSFGPSDT